jgi:hypothetical protein
MNNRLKTGLLAAALTLGASTMGHADSFLEITLKINPADRAAAGAVYEQYKQPFLTTVAGATSKQLLMRDEDVQVLHGFKTAENAQAYLKSDLFNNDVVKALTPLLQAAPDIRIYTAN